MSMPWALASRNTQVDLWNDDQDVALRGVPVRDVGSSVSGDLLKTQRPALEPVNGRASVSGVLSLRHAMRTESATGASTVWGILGWLYGYEGASSGSSSVSGELLHGQVESISGSSSGSATVAGQYNQGAPALDVRRYSHIDGSQDGDDWGDGEDLPPAVSSARSVDGRARNQFSPRASGRVSEQRAWMDPGAGSDAAAGE